MYMYTFTYILLLLYYLKTLCFRVISCYDSRKRGESAIRKSQIGGRNKLKWVVNFAKIEVYHTHPTTYFYILWLKCSICLKKSCF